MKYLLIPIALLFIGCSETKQGYLEESRTECDTNGVLWTVYQDGHKKIHVDDIGRYERCGG